MTRLKLLSCIVQSYKGTLQNFHSESDTGRILRSWVKLVFLYRNSHILWWEKFFAEHGTFTPVQACQLTAHYNNIYTLNRLTLNDLHLSSTSFTNTIRMFRLLITRTNDARQQCRDNNHLNPVVTELKHTFETAVYTATDFNMTHLQWGYTLWDNSLISIDKTGQSTN